MDVRADSVTEEGFAYVYFDFSIPVAEGLLLLGRDVLVSEEDDASLGD